MEDSIYGEGKGKGRFLDSQQSFMVLPLEESSVYEEDEESIAAAERVDIPSSIYPIVKQNLGALIKKESNKILQGNTSYTEEQKAAILALHLAIKYHLPDQYLARRLEILRKSYGETYDFITVKLFSTYEKIKFCDCFQSKLPIVSYVRPMKTKKLAVANSKRAEFKTLDNAFDYIFELYSAVNYTPGLQIGTIEKAIEPFIGKLTPKKFMELAIKNFGKRLDQNNACYPLFGIGIALYNLLQKFESKKSKHMFLGIAIKENDKRKAMALYDLELARIEELPLNVLFEKNALALSACLQARDGVVKGNAAVILGALHNVFAQSQQYVQIKFEEKAKISPLILSADASHIKLTLLQLIESNSRAIDKIQRGSKYPLAYLKSFLMRKIAERAEYNLKMLWLELKIAVEVGDDAAILIVLNKIHKKINIKGKSKLHKDFRLIKEHFKEKIDVSERPEFDNIEELASLEKILKILDYKMRRDILKKNPIILNKLCRLISLINITAPRFEIMIQISRLLNTKKIIDVLPNQIITGLMEFYNQHAELCGFDKIMDCSLSLPSNIFDALEGLIQYSFEEGEENLTTALRDAILEGDKAKVSDLLVAVNELQERDIYGNFLLSYCNLSKHIDLAEIVSQKTSGNSIVLALMSNIASSIHKDKGIRKDYTRFFESISNKRIFMIHVQLAILPIIKSPEWDDANQTLLIEYLSDRLVGLWKKGGLNVARHFSCDTDTLMDELRGINSDWNTHYSANILNPRQRQVSKAKQDILNQKVKFIKTCKQVFLSTGKEMESFDRIYMLADSWRFMGEAIVDLTKTMNSEANLQLNDPIIEADIDNLKDLRFTTMIDLIRSFSLTPHDLSELNWFTTKTYRKNVYDICANASGDAEPVELEGYDHESIEKIINLKGLRADNLQARRKTYEARIEVLRSLKVFFDKHYEEQILNDGKATIDLDMSGS